MAQTWPTLSVFISEEPNVNVNLLLAFKIDMYLPPMKLVPFKAILGIQCIPTSPCGK